MRRREIVWSNINKSIFAKVCFGLNNYTGAGILTSFPFATDCSL